MQPRSSRLSKVAGGSSSRSSGSETARENPDLLHIAPGLKLFFQWKRSLLGRSWARQLSILEGAGSQRPLKEDFPPRQGTTGSEGQTGSGVEHSPSGAGGGSKSGGPETPGAAAVSGYAAQCPSRSSSRTASGPHSSGSRCCNEPRRGRPAGSRMGPRGLPSRLPTEARVRPWALHSAPAAHRRATYCHRPPRPKSSAVSGVTSPRAARLCRQPRPTVAQCRKSGSLDWRPERAASAPLCGEPVWGTPGKDPGHSFGSAGAEALRGSRGQRTLWKGSGVWVARGEVSQRMGRTARSKVVA